MSRSFQLTPDELRFLAASEDFQQIIACDPELDRLETMQYDEEMECQILRENLGIPSVIGDVTIRHLTAGKWSYLWSRKNPYVRGGNVTAGHIAEFLSVLSADDVTRVPVADPKRTGLSYAELHECFSAIVRNAFLPLQQLPRDPGTTAETRFDSEWLIRVCSIAAGESQTPLHNVIHYMNLNTLCQLYVEHRRRFEKKGVIRHRPAEEIAQKMLERTMELGYIYLKKTGK